MQKTLFLLLSIFITTCSNLYGAAFDQQLLDEAVKTILSQEFFDTSLSKHRDKIRQYTRETFPDLYNKTVQEQEGGCLYNLVGVIELYKATANSTKSRKYPLYWLSLAQVLVDNIKDESKKSKAEKCVHAHAEYLLIKARLEQIKEMEKEVALFGQIANYLKNEDAQ